MGRSPSFFARPRFARSRPAIVPALALMLLPGAPSPDFRSAENVHIVVIVLENHEYSEVMGNAAAPYLNRLARSKVLLTHSYAVAHPSLPDYLAMIGGSTFGVTRDSTPPLPDGTLVDQLEKAGISWKGYMETMPSACFLKGKYGASPNKYVRRHNPFMNFSLVRDTQAWCKKVVPYSQLGTDLSAGSLPRFAWITPNLCSDMHSCGVGAGDAWLAAQVPLILRKLGKTGILIVNFDEGSTSAGCCGGTAAGGHILTVIAGPGAADGVKVTADVDTYSVLRLIEHVFGQPYLRKAGAAPVINGYACLVPPCS